MSNPTPPYAVTVGIDWADLKHDVFERHPDGSLHHQQISSSPEAITNWLFALRSVSAEGRVALFEQRTAFIEQLRHALAEYYPAALEAFKDWTSVSARMFLERFPSPELLAQAQAKVAELACTVAALGQRPGASPHGDLRSRHRTE